MNDISLGITVSPEVENFFLGYLKSLRPRPDKVSTSKYGVSAVWEDLSDRESEEIIGFVEKLDEDQYVYEGIYSSSNGDIYRYISGNYNIDFGTKLVYVMYGEPVDLNAVMSGNKKKIFGRRR